MTYLLDTHTFLWAIIQPANLSAKASAIISDRSQEVQVSVVTFWEIGIKHALGKLELQGVQPEQMPKVAEDLGGREGVALEQKHAKSCACCTEN